MAGVSEKPLNAAEQIRLRDHHRCTRNQPIPIDPPLPQLQSRRCKPTNTISSLFLSTFTNNNNTNANANANATATANKKKKKKSTFGVRGLGCTSSAHAQQVSAPAAVVIRSSADWQSKKSRKKKKNKKKKNKIGETTTTTTTTTSAPTSANTPAPAPAPAPSMIDVWCAPGMAFAAADATSSVDCVVSRRPLIQNQGRPIIDAAAHRSFNHRERSCVLRRAANLDHITLLDSSTDYFEAARFGSDVFGLGGRHHRHFRHTSPGGLAQIMLLQRSLLSEGRSDGYDRYREWRLDVDNMTYEELLELGERIGYVNTGLRDDEIYQCLRKSKHALFDSLASHFPTEMEWKCSICQEEYEADDDVGKLECGHSYHTSCIKQWLRQKNACPVCKVSAVAEV
ncbi:hypothetical protein Sjap_024964 [Stephania japonica]|uniref:RING-type E3 ubiquitin transferase n=1 Tax=Stephania japonica TaxID=461633 RepID=A0AAP0EJA0_9MAGN